MSGDGLHTIHSVRVEAGSQLALKWDNGETAVVDLSDIVKARPFKALADEAVFERVEVGDWGHSLVWPGDIEIGADSLWLDSLSAWGRDDTRTFLEWRMRNGLSLSAAAEALGLSRRTIAYYSGGRAVPRSILLACKGWDALKAAA